MSVNLKIFLIILLLIQVCLLIKTIKIKKLTMRYASFWLILIFIMMIAVIFPEIIISLSKILGFEKASNMIFLLSFFFLFYVSFVITTSISINNEKVKLLIKEVSMLKKKVDENGKKE